MKFYTSWVDTAFYRYRLKQKQVNIIAVKHWFRQILRGLLYLHSLDPAVIHRDLNCDNIFVNGNQGEVKIGDLGLVAILKKSYAAHCVRTSELMGPEVYEGACNELVSIYSFGMCILEIVTFDYPYSECTHPTQIYKKVISIKDAQSELRPLDYCERDDIGPLIRKYAVKRKAVDIWGCKDRRKDKDGGAYTLETDVLTVRSKLKLVVPTL
ncbi:hypothetical protein Ddye_016250 [Dipteronia dyeriana]|uniref:non-specific serine/threonine protein kinase n=1 Tax=Dipteronia dyeriana TaxID=168575 RepID=A0AAD9U6E6_9ROSI|nr:hypothetical protein Ddye_016250 [Dipteronia dyeriana]